MKHSVSHDIGQQKALEAARAAFDAYKARFGKYDPHAEWVSDTRANISFKAKGISLKGSIEVKPSTIDMDLDVPFMLRPFKSMALGTVEEEIRRWVDKARAGEI
jgi:hypothetical protein